VNDCYTSLTGNSAFCDRITRDLSDPTAPFIDLINAGFINRDSETARGLDINIAFDDTITVFDRPASGASPSGGSRTTCVSTTTISALSTRCVTRAR
jgi:hypothetical protein